MFGTKTGNNAGAFPVGSTTLIAAETELQGTLVFTGHLEIEGKIFGNVVSDDENARVRVLPGGSVEGEIRAANVVINGRVKGNIYAGTKAQLIAQARVEGNVHYSIIEMESGAEIIGNLVHAALPTNISEFPKENLTSEVSESAGKTKQPPL